MWFSSVFEGAFIKYVTRGGGGMVSKICDIFSVTYSICAIQGVLWEFQEVLEGLRMFSRGIRRFQDVQRGFWRDPRFFNEIQVYSRTLQRISRGFQECSRGLNGVPGLLGVFQRI